MHENWKKVKLTLHVYGIATHLETPVSQHQDLHTHREIHKYTKFRKACKDLKLA